MKELTGKQIETLRIGLQIGFREPRTLAMFLREKLNKPYVNYVAERDKFPEACFNIVTYSEGEAWRDDLIREAHKAHPKNPNIAKVGRELGLIAEQDAGEDWSPDEVNAAKAEQPLWRSYNPYRGMLALREQDANYLFGRDEDVDRFIDAIEAGRPKILLALGASGVGKSSLIFAGVLGALRRRARKSKKSWPVALDDSHKWPHLVLTPETEPLYSLAGAFVRQWIDETEPRFRTKTNEWRALLADGDSVDGLVKAADAARRRQQEDPPPRYLIYIDQGEELYTRGGRDPGRDGTTKETPQQKEARRFSELLAEAAAHPRLIVLMSARSDFLGSLQDDKRISDEQSLKIFDVHEKIDILKLNEEGLRQVIVRPAEMLGVCFENRLDKVLATAIVTSVAVTPDGARIVTGSDDKTARIWDAASGRELARLSGHEGMVTSVAVTPDGARIVTGSSDKTVRIWDAASGRELARLSGHEGIVTSVAVTPDGSRIVTGADDTTARIWDAASGRELARLAGHEDTVTSVAVTPDGARIVTGSTDKTARIWGIFPFGQALIDHAKKIAPRCLTSVLRDRFYLTPAPPRWCFDMAKWPYDEKPLQAEEKREAHE